MNKAHTYLMQSSCHKCGEAADGYYCGDCRAWINEARRNRKFIRFRNCFCGTQAVRFRDGSFLCARHYQAERERCMQDPDITAENIRRSNAECEKRRVARLKNRGLCVTCGQRPANSGITRCEPCQAKRRKAKILAPGQAHPWEMANRQIFRTRTHCLA
jgi:hypothetical protein